MTEVHIKQAYDLWSETYDIGDNPTRDLEANAIRNILSAYRCETILELGCGTGKNTGFLSSCAEKVVAVDFSGAMLKQARERWNNSSIEFFKTDICSEWDFLTTSVGAITCSLVLEHIEELHLIFQQASNYLKPGGIFYIGELHPYRQYRGVRPHFEHKGQQIELDYHIHHLSDYMSAAKNNGLQILRLEEWFDDDDRGEEPRLVSFIFHKQ